MRTIHLSQVRRPYSRTLIFGLLQVVMWCFTTFPVYAVERLFTDAPQTQTLAKQPVLNDAKRSRACRLNTAAYSNPTTGLRRPMGRVVLNLFPGLEPTGILEQVEELAPGRWTGWGQIEGEPGGQFVIAMTGRSLAATVFIPTKGHFRILPGENQTHAIMEIDPARSGLCGICKKEMGRLRFRTREPSPRRPAWFRCNQFSPNSRLW